jgi:hypothetical protein
MLALTVSGSLQKYSICLINTPDTTRQLNAVFFVSMRVFNHSTLLAVDRQAEWNQI